MPCPADARHRPGRNLPQQFVTEPLFPARTLDMVSSGGNVRIGKTHTLAEEKKMTAFATPEYQSWINQLVEMADAIDFPVDFDEVRDAYVEGLSPEAALVQQTL
jgi:hypothetical protein